MESVTAWLVHKKFLWLTNHPLKQAFFPDGDGAHLALPLFGTPPRTIYDDTRAELPGNRVGDYCDRVEDPFCGYWHSAGWSDGNLGTFPDPEDWRPIAEHMGSAYVSCSFR